MSSIQIAGVSVRQDKEQRFSLNDIHNAAVANGVNRRSKEPSKFLASAIRSELELELTTQDPGSLPVVTIEGRNGGTFVCKELVYAYAMWASPSFHLHVIRSFDRLQSEERAKQEAIRSRQAARLEAPQMTDAIKVQREACGKDIRAHHFSNEFDLINRIALGQTSKQYRAEHAIGKEESIRDHLTAGQIKCIEHLQRLNTSLIEIGMPFEERKAKLNQVYILRHKRGLIVEVMRLEA